MASSYKSSSITAIVNLSNSIIGVSILAMPLCFKQCGLVLALFIILFSALLNYFSCYLLLKSAIINRRRNYELLAYDVFGSSGKTLVEVCILFFLLGTCVAFFVIVGDIAPSLISHIFQLEQGPQLRALIMTILAMFIILPLGLLRNVENLTSFSMLSLLVYLFLALRMLSLCLDRMLESKPLSSPTLPSSLDSNDRIIFWNSSHLITYLPIFSMALSCQSQLFEIFNSDLFQTKSGSLRLIMRSTKRAILICSFVYSVIGLFGYMAFYNTNLGGNILQSLPNGFSTKLTLLFFLITILTSFPLCLFPSRTSLHSLLFRKGLNNDFLSTSHSIHMSDYHFKLLTIILIITTMSISILFPRVELILALVGSTIGSTICYIIPALIFIKICDKNTVEYLFSYLLLFFGTAILIFCTVSALHNISIARDAEIEEKINVFKQKSNLALSTQAPLINEPNFQPLKQNEMKNRINNINKLKQSIQIDIEKLKKQEEILLKRLEEKQMKKSKTLSNEHGYRDRIRLQSINATILSFNESSSSRSIQRKIESKKIQKMIPKFNASESFEILSNRTVVEEQIVSSQNLTQRIAINISIQQNKNNGSKKQYSNKSTSAISQQKQKENDLLKTNHSTIRNTPTNNSEKHNENSKSIRISTKKPNETKPNHSNTL
ncbi:Lysozyme-like domain-containing protein [Sarcoptes scabiei]|nr:Lysozyme-like domain-containing protein [Sarcoptes scabiei]